MNSVKAINSVNKALSPNINKTAQKLANGLSHFKGADALLPVLLIESCVTGGRTIQSYKRGGKTEARERFVEQGVSAVVWLFGVKVLNKVADKLGGLFLNKDYLKADVAKDAHRDPFKNIVKNDQVRTAAFKFSKLAINTTIATAFIGFILPNMIKKMTKKHLSEEQDKQNNVNQAQTQNAQASNNVQTPNNEQVAQTQQPAQNTAPAAAASPFSIDNFVKNTKPISFKGSGDVVNTLLNITNKLENDTRYRLMSTDVGIITGRTLNARNKYEAREFLFRDTASIYFYLFCADHILKALSKITKNVDIHPKAAVELADMLIKHQDALSGLAQNMQEAPANVDKLFDGIKGDVIPFERFEAVYGGNKALMEKAEKMAKLQPIFDNQKFLSKQQVQDVLSNKITSNPDFLYEIYDKVTKGKFAQPDKYVSKKELEKIRKSLDEFTEAIIKYAKDKNLEINIDTINKCLKKNLALNSLFTLSGIAVSGAMLALVIPKIQNYMTKKSTGSDSFPGVTEYNK